ncbi:MAG TPA: hypothetical protein VER35_01295 [Candidatus Limnocylindrales bacterium]|nr:hypothetical protein [Candidatus Limnocylindrales bacterium]
MSHLMKRSGNGFHRELPDGFGSTKKRKTHTKDHKDRNLIKLLSKQALDLLEADFSLNVKPTCIQVIEDHYTKNRTPKVFLNIYSIYI